MQGQPLSRLLVTVIMELVINGTFGQGLEEIAADIFGKLTTVDKNESAGHVAIEQYPAPNGDSDLC